MARKRDTSLQSETAAWEGGWMGESSHVGTRCTRTSRLPTSAPVDANFTISGLRVMDTFTAAPGHSRSSTASFSAEVCAPYGRGLKAKPVARVRERRTSTTTPAKSTAHTHTHTRTHTRRSPHGLP